MNTSRSPYNENNTKLYKPKMQNLKDPKIVTDLSKR